jgi:hypothetical protein
MEYGGMAEKNGEQPRHLNDGIVGKIIVKSTS